MLSPRNLPSLRLLSLRNLLLADALTCVAMGTVLDLGAAELAEFTRIPATLLLYAGLSLFPIAAFMAVVALRPTMPLSGVRLIIAGNAVWVAGSFAILLTGWAEPNALGTAFIAAQALTVAALARLEHNALRARRLELRAS